LGWAVVGSYDTFVSQFFPKSVQEYVPNLYEIVSFLSPGWSLTTWAIIGLAIINLATLEFAFRQNRKTAIEDAKAATTNENSTIPYSQWSQLKQIDMATAAAIYAGTRDDNDVNRHLRFRELKQAAAEKKLDVINMNGPKPNIRTTVTPAALKRYFDSLKKPE